MFSTETVEIHSHWQSTVSLDVGQMKSTLEERKIRHWRWKSLQTDNKIASNCNRNSIGEINNKAGVKSIRE